MKHIITLISVLFSLNLFGQSVGINNPSGTPDSSAVLDVWSNDKGVLLPRLTKMQRDGILNPAEGLTIFQMDEGTGYYAYYSGTWNPIGSNYNDNILQIGSESGNDAYLINDFGDIIDSSGIVYDSGGPTGQHGSFVNYTRTIYPPSPGAIGLKINIDNIDIAGSATLLINGQPYYDGEEAIFITPNIVTTITFTNAGFPDNGFEVIFEYIYVNDTIDNCKTIPIAGGWQFDRTRNAEYGGMQTGPNWISDSLGLSSVQYGLNNGTSGNYSAAFGQGNLASGESASAIGGYNTSTGYGSFAAGANSTASGNGSVALGNFNFAQANGSVALGEGNSSDGGNGSVAIGYNSFVDAFDGSMALGSSSFVSGDYGSIAMGSNTQTSGSDGAAAIGYYANASGSYGSVALGESAIASGGFGSIAAGSNTEASGHDGAIALGRFTTASGDYGSFAGGINTIASGQNGATALGDGAEASGSYGAMALGYGAQAKGSYGATAIGDGTIATGEGMVAVGVYNDTIVATGYNNPVDKPVFVVGVGTNDANRKNAIEVLNGGMVNIGENNMSSGTNGSVNIGKANQNSGDEGAIAIGSSNINNSLGGIAIGHINNISGGSGSTAMGYENLVNGSVGSMAIGAYNTVDGEVGSVAIGFSSRAEGDYGAIAIGVGANAKADLGSIAIGSDVQSNAQYGIVLGIYNDTIVAPNYSGSDAPVLIVGIGENDANRENALIIRKGNRISLGNGNIINGGSGGNVAIGIDNQVDGFSGSTAIGDFNFIQSDVSGSVALGYYNDIYGGYGASALGAGNYVDGGYGSVAVGANLISYAVASTTVGRYNDPIVTAGYDGADAPVFIVGTGESGALDNGMEIYRGGDVIVNSLEGIGNRKVLADSSGKLFAATGSQYYSVHHNSFVGDFLGSSIIGYQYHELSIACSGDDYCDTKLYAPVNLPHNAKIKSVKYNYRFDGGTQTLVDAHFVARKYDSNTSFTISKEALPRGSGYLSVTDITMDPAYDTVDNSLYTYYVQIGNPSDIPQSTIFAVRNIIIEYE